MVVWTRGVSMASEAYHLDLRGLKPDQQVARLKEQFVSLRGKGAVVRARVGGLRMEEPSW